MARLSLPLWQGLILAALVSLPGVRADCWVDFNGFEHCSLSTGARVGIAIAIAAFAFLFIAAALVFRQRRMQRNVVYAAPSANAQSYSYSGYGGQPANYAPNYSPGYYPGTPQYPPPVHGYDPQSGFAPPQGPPPGYYAPPQGPPPGKERLDA